MGRSGVVLAAGLGTRLVGDTSLLKPMQCVGGTPLITRTVRSLALAGCSEVVVVVGHRGAELRSAIEGLSGLALPLRFAFNPRYELSNGISLLAAAETLTSEFVLAMADHVFGDEIMAIVRGRHPPRDGATLAVDHAVDGVFDLEDATKVECVGEQLLRIGKGLNRYNCIDTGIFVATSGLIEAIRGQVLRTGDASVTDGVQALAAAGRMTVFEVSGGFWQDIDDPRMLAHAEGLIAGRVGPDLSSSPR